MTEVSIFRARSRAQQDVIRPETHGILLWVWRLSAVIVPQEPYVIEEKTVFQDGGVATGQLLEGGGG